MSSPELLSAYFKRLDAGSALRWRGRVKQVVGQLVESEGPFCSVGKVCEVMNASGRIFPAKLWAFAAPRCCRCPSSVRWASVTVTTS